MVDHASRVNASRRSIILGWSEKPVRFEPLLEHPLELEPALELALEPVREHGPVHAIAIALALVLARDQTLRTTRRPHAVRTRTVWIRPELA